MELSGKQRKPSVYGGWLGFAGPTTKGIVLLERHRVKVIVGKRVCPKTGCITPRTAWRTVKVLVASIKTRLGDWSLVPKKHQAQAITQAEQRCMEQPDTPAT